MFTLVRVAEMGRPPQGPWGELSSVERGVGNSRLKWADASSGRRIKGSDRSDSMLAV
jgi:hypothetical protein